MPRSAACAQLLILTSNYSSWSVWTYQLMFGRLPRFHAGGLCAEAVSDTVSSGSDNASVEPGRSRPPIGM